MVVAQDLTSTGTYRYAVVPAFTGDLQFRVVKPADALYVAGYSRGVVVRVG